MAEVPGELRVSVQDQEARSAKKAIEGISQVASDLRHEALVRVWCDPSNVHRTRAEVDQEQDVMRDESPSGPDLYGEEISSGDDVRV